MNPSRLVVILALATTLSAAAREATLPGIGSAIEAMIANNEVTGAVGTQAWLDPVKGVGYILMVQRSNFPNSDASDVRRAFQQAAVAALAHK
jgi:hypothetical protein